MLTSSGPRVLSDACPKDADEIENLILSKRWPLPAHFVSPKCVGVSSLQLHGRLPAGNGTQEVCSASRCRMHQDLNVAKKLNRFFSPIFYRVQKQFAPWTRFPKDRGPTSAWKWDQISVLSISSDTTGGCNELRKEQAGFRIHWHIFGKLTIGMYFMFFTFTSDNWAAPMKLRCCARAVLHYERCVAASQKTSSSVYFFKWTPTTGVLLVGKVLAGNQSGIQAWWWSCLSRSRQGCRVGSKIFRLDRSFRLNRSCFNFKGNPNLRVWCKYDPIGRPKSDKKIRLWPPVLLGIRLRNPGFRISVVS